MPPKSRLKLEQAINAASVPSRQRGGDEAAAPRGGRRREREPEREAGTLPSSRYDEDRVRDTEAQIRRIDALLDEVGTADVQGVARLVSTRRGLVEDLHAELLRRQSVDVGGDSTQLEATLAEALAEMDSDSVRRVLQAAAGRAGVELLAWVGDGD